MRIGVVRLQPYELGGRGGAARVVDGAPGLGGLSAPGDPLPDLQEPVVQQLGVRGRRVEPAADLADVT